jgi:molybdopterin converting factor small subunit
MTPATIRVSVRPQADLGRFFDTKSCVCQIVLPAGATVASLLEASGIPDDLPLVIGINKELGAKDSVLANGDNIDLLPPMSGGGKDCC